MKKLLNLGILLIASLSTLAQEDNRKFWLSGAARSVLYLDSYEGANFDDTTTVPKLNSGHTLVDLGANIRPNDNMFIHGMVRVRNDYGGFWGAGVSFDVRQIYVKGVIADVVRYEVGDINYKLTPYTLYNFRDPLQNKLLDYTSIYTDLIDYDLFYDFDNAWRQQGASANFALGFNKFIERLEFNGFISRQNPSNFADVNDRLLGGGNITLVQSERLQLGVNYINMFDLLGTSTNDSSGLRNPVTTVSGVYKYPMDDLNVELFTEFGNSNWEVTKDTLRPVYSDFFYEAGVRASKPSLGIDASVKYKNVGAQFSAIGAQTRQLNFNSTPAAFGRFGNNAVVRPISWFDMLRDASIYEPTLTSRVGYNLAYGATTPYGEATPNRRGFIINVNQGDKKGYYDVNVSAELMSEVVGEGTTELRSFNVLNAKVNFHLHKLFANYKKEINLSAAYWNESVSRGGNEQFESVDLNNSAIDLQLEVEFVNKGYLIAGFRDLQSDGNEYVMQFDALERISNFARYNATVSDQLIVAGGKFDFENESSLSLLYNYNRVKTSYLTEDEYIIDGVSIIYNIKF